MTTEQTTPTETTELESGFSPNPVLAVAASLPPVKGAGYGGSLRIKAFPGDWASTGGDIAVVAEAMSRAAAAMLTQQQPGRRKGIEAEFKPVSPAVVQRIFDRIRAANARPTAEQAEEALARAEQAAQECAAEHRAHVDALRQLVMQARSDKAASDRAEAARAEANPAGDDPADEPVLGDDAGQVADEEAN